MDKSSNCRTMFPVVLRNIDQPCQIHFWSNSFLSREVPYLGTKPRWDQMTHIIWRVKWSWKNSGVGKCEIVSVEEIVSVLVGYLPVESFFSEIEKLSWSWEVATSMTSNFVRFFNIVDLSNSIQNFSTAIVIFHFQLTFPTPARTFQHRSCQFYLQLSNFSIFPIAFSKSITQCDS